MNGTLQDRLVKALRVEGIDDIAAANAYLQSTFPPQLNARFAVAPADATDVHMPVDAAHLAAALCERADRVVSQDQCVMWAGCVLQLDSPVNLARKRVEVRRLLDGQTGGPGPRGDEAAQNHKYIDNDHRSRSFPGRRTCRRAM